jgi:hypothetical protein
MNSKITNLSSETLKLNAQQLLKSPDGQKSIQTALQEAKNITLRLQEDRRVDQKSLHEPFTV